MSHQVLARKLRPKKFADIIGQNVCITVLLNILSKERLHHAYLLTGTRGVGKTTIARIIAKSLNCPNCNNGEPCTHCTSCNQIDQGSMIDVIEIDAASNTGVDNIRELIENAKYAPTESQYKVYIIDEVHMLSKAAFNALLKTLEEPPAHVIFILATTELNKIPITVLSRCLQLKLRHLNAHEIANYLQKILVNENIIFEKTAVELIATYAKGSMRDALSLTDQAIAYSNQNITLSTTQKMLGLSDNQIIFDILKALNLKDAEQIITLAQQCKNNGYSFEEILNNLSDTLCNLSIIQLCPTNVLANNDQLIKLANYISVNDVHLYFEICNLAVTQLTTSSNKFAIFMMSLLRMLAFTIGSEQDKQLLLQNNNFNTAIAQKNDTDNINHTEHKDNIVDNIDISQNHEVYTTFANHKIITNITPEIVTDINATLNTDGANTNIQSVEYEIKQNNNDSYIVHDASYQQEQTNSKKLNIVQNHDIKIVVQNNDTEAIIQRNIPTIQPNNNSKTGIIDNIINNKQLLDLSSPDTIALATQIKQENQALQEKAKSAIYNDQNLIALLNQFSAKIMPDSIKLLSQ